MGDRKYLLFRVPEFLDRETEELRALAQSGVSTLELSSAMYAWAVELFGEIKKDGDSTVRSVKAFLKEK